MKGFVGIRSGKEDALLSTHEGGLFYIFVLGMFDFQVFFKKENLL